MYHARFIVNEEEFYPDLYDFSSVVHYDEREELDDILNLIDKMQSIGYRLIRLSNLGGITR